MSEYTEQLASLMRRLDEAERELAGLRRDVFGELPAPGDGVSLVDRLEALNRMAVAALVGGGEPVVIQGSPAAGDENAIPLMDIEYGVPRTTPTTTPVKSIVLRPCNSAGVLYDAFADETNDVRVLIRNDKKAQYIGHRGWLGGDGTGSPLLSFIRLPLPVNDGGGVGYDCNGLLVGEGGQRHLVAVTWDDAIPGLLRFFSVAKDAPQTAHKLIGDSEQDILTNTTGHCNEVAVINGGNEEQAKIKHVGPGPVDDRSGAAAGWTYCLTGAGAGGADIYVACDVLGHVLNVWQI